MKFRDLPVPIGLNMARWSILRGVLVGLLAVTANGLLQAQELPAQSNVVTTLQLADQPDTGRLGEQLTELEAGIPGPDQLAHLHLASEILARAELLQEPALIARAELAVAQHLRTRGLWEQVQAHAQAALAAATRAGDARLKLQARLLLAAIMVQQEQLAPAQAALFEILDAAEAANDVELQVRALLSLSSAAGRLGDLNSAKSLVDRGLPIAQAHDLRELRVRLLINRTQILRLQGNIEEAALAVRLAHQIKLDPPLQEISQTLLLVDIAMAMGEDVGRAAQMAEEVVAQTEASGNRHLQAFALAAQARALCSNQTSINPAQNFERAAQIYADLDLPSERANVLNEAAECVAKGGQHQRAFELAQQSRLAEHEAVERRRSEVAASLNVAYQSEQRQKALATAELAAERLRAQVAAQQRDRLVLVALALTAICLAFWAWTRIRAREARARIVEAAQLARIDLLAQTSHEIRNPAHGLVSALGALRSMPHDPAVDRLLNAASHAADLIARLASDALDLSLIEQGRLGLHLEQVELDELLREIEQLVQPAAQAKGLSLQIQSQIAPELAASIDRQRISQVLLNLLGNAVRYSDHGVIELRSWFDAEGATKQWHIEVADCGPGLAADEMERVFEAYFRGSASPRGVGGGLGLTVAMRIVQAHGGSMHVRNRDEGGAVFSIALPILLAPDAASSPDAVPAPKQQRVGTRLLIIDDDEFVRLGARLIAESAGMQVRELESDEGLDQEVRDFRPDAVLCDRHLGKSDGVALLQELRRRHPGVVPKLILMTGAEVLPAVKAPLDAVLGKPFALDDLLAALN